jgi:hypothetical protein
MMLWTRTWSESSPSLIRHSSRSSSPSLPSPLFSPQERLPGYFSIATRWKSVLSKEFYRRQHCGIGRLILTCLTSLNDFESIRLCPPLSSSPHSSPHSLLSLAAERALEHTITCVSSRISLSNPNSTLLFNQPEVESGNICRHIFRTLEDLCNMFSSLLLSSTVTCLEV